MRALLGLIKKEFIQVFRDPYMPRLIFAMPVLQLILFGYVVNTEVKDVDLAVYDFDRTHLSREFVAVTGAGGYFTPADGRGSVLALHEGFKDGSAEMALIIPEDFSERLDRGRSVSVGLVADGTNANRTALGTGYLSQIAGEFSRKTLDLHPPLEVRSRFLYNPEAESVYFMVPGIVATILTMLTIMLTSMAIVRERESGTLEQILVTPIASTTLLLGKIIPFALLGLLEMSLALGLGVLWFGVPFVGSPLLLVALSLLFLMTTLGLGMLISTLTTTQQQAMFFAWFFSVFAMLTSGFFTPVSNMPDWMQTITLLNPMRYFVEIARGIIMKGSSLTELWPQVYPLVIFGTVVFGLAWMRFTKRAA
jgi:ABC-2 type transport system permease protein